MAKRGNEQTPRTRLVFIAALAIAFCRTNLRGTAAADGGGDLEAIKNYPADMKALLVAGGKNDPQAKLDAYRKFMKDFPKSSFVTSANVEILQVLAKSFPTHTAEINKQIDLVLKKEDQGSTGDTIAEALMESDALLNRAEKFANQAIEELGDGTKFIADTKTSYAKAKIPLPDDKEFQKIYATTRARYRSTLGTIYIKQGRTAEGEQLLKEAYELEPWDYRLVKQIAEVELKAGREDAGFDYLVQARLRGNLDRDDEVALERLYKKTHGDSIADFEAFLDKRHEEMFPEPAAPDPYQAPADRSDRVALVELVTGSGCPACVDTDIAVDQVLKRYSRKDVVVLAYHRHSPRPDPMANPCSIRQSGTYKVLGVPTLAIDGERHNRAGADAEGEYRDISATVDKELQLPADAAIHLIAVQEGNSVRAHVTADKIKTPSTDLHLQIVLVELHQRFSGENGIRFHPMVVRNVANLEKNGFEVRTDGPTTVDYSFDIGKISRDLKTYLEDYEVNNDRYGKFQFIELKNAIDVNDLAVAAFVQDAKTKHVLQASFATVREAHSASVITKKTGVAE